MRQISSIYYQIAVYAQNTFISRTICNYDHTLKLYILRYYGNRKHLWVITLLLHGAIDKIKTNVFS